MAIPKLTVGTEGAVNNSRGSNLKALTDALVNAVEHPTSGLAALKSLMDGLITVSADAPTGTPPVGAVLHVHAANGKNTIYSNLNGVWYSGEVVDNNFVWYPADFAWR